MQDQVPSSFADSVNKQRFGLQQQQVQKNSGKNCEHGAKAAKAHGPKLPKGPHSKAEDSSESHSLASSDDASPKQKKIGSYHNMFAYNNYRPQEVKQDGH